MSIELLSPCKINLFLHINGRRDDGYHELQTIFQLLDYGDSMRFETSISNQITISPNLIDIPLETNLIWRAARLLQKSVNRAQGAHITINKRIPMGGGLGGGSSNAATTLLALNKLWELNLSIDELAALGKTLGADVPVFVRGHSAFAEGIGDELTSMDLPRNWYLVIYPGCLVNTAKIFSDKRLTRNTSKLKIAPALEGYGSSLRNDCEPLVRSMFEPVDQAINWLDKYSKAMLTGTGACVFAKFENMTKAVEVLNKIPEQFKGFVAQGINQSPVHKELEKRT
jgi:4-diphosphocytidyl-2-C-methyl-D-erythritol kinase